MRERARRQQPKKRIVFSEGSDPRVLAAAERLEAEHGIAADVYSVTSFTELRREAMETQAGAQIVPGIQNHPPSGSNAHRP